VTPEIARMAGEINTAVNRCGFSLRETEPSGRLCRVCL
jgi:hypothetical protein